MKKLILLLLFIPLIFSCSKETVKYSLTTSVNPIEGGAINPNGGIVDEGTQISLTASPNSEYLFDKWTGAASGNSPSISVIMDSDKSVTANFVKKKYTLTTSVEGEGTVTEKVIKAGTATDYNSGTILELTAVPSSEWEFKEWTGDLTGTENPKQITIDKAKTVKAVFEQPAFYIDENGVTIKARDWVTVGTTEELGGVTYIAVDNNTLKSMVQNNDDLSKAVTTLVTDMEYLLFGNNIQNPDISSWDVSNVTTMKRMFSGANLFNQNIGSWDVSKVVTMNNMFSYAETFNQDIGSWDVSKVSSMREMFRRTLEFNQDLTKWCVTYITNEPGDFSKDSALTYWNKPIWGTCPSD